VAEWRLRPARVEDADEIVALLNAHSEELTGEADLSTADLRQWFDNPRFDVERDTRVAVNGAGGILAYVDVGDPNDEHRRYWIDLRLPRGVDRAIGDALVEAMEARARETALGGALVRGVADSADATARELFAERGYGLIRHSFRMRIDLGGAAVPEPEWPEGVGLVPFDREGHARAVYEADTEAFEDHWEFVRTPYDEWAHWFLSGEDHDPGLWFVAWDTGEIAGVSLCRMHAAETGVGYVTDLSVRRPWRRRGLALALLRHSFREFERRGCHAVTLHVDAENTTGAVRLYERAGMRPDRRRDILERPLE
jgi:mycothiol synthase